MKRAIIIIILAVAVLALGYGAYSLFSGGTPGTEQPPVTVNVTSTTSVATSSQGQVFPTTDKITIGTQSGTVTINNPYKNAVYITPDKGNFFVLNTSDYAAYYLPSDSSFSLGIFKTPIPQEQIVAEQAFLNALGITAVDACKLKVIVAVPVSVDPDYAGRNLGLSFCPQGQ